MEGQVWVPVSCLCTLSAPPTRISGLRFQNLNPGRRKKVGRKDLRLRYEIGWDKPSFTAHHFLQVPWAGLSWVQALLEGLTFLSTPQCATLWPAGVLPHVTAIFLQPISVDPGVLFFPVNYLSAFMWFPSFYLVVPQLLSPVLNFLWNCKHEFVNFLLEFCNC